MPTIRPRRQRPGGRFGRPSSSEPDHGEGYGDESYATPTRTRAHGGPGHGASWITKVETGDPPRPLVEDASRDMLIGCRARDRGEIRPPPPPGRRPDRGPQNLLPRSASPAGRRREARAFLSRLHAIETTGRNTDARGGLPRLTARGSSPNGRSPSCGSCDPTTRASSPARQVARADESAPGVRREVATGRCRVLETLRGEYLTDHGTSRVAGRRLRHAIYRTRSGPGRRSTPIPGVHRRDGGAADDRRQAPRVAASAGASDPNARDDRREPANTPGSKGSSATGAGGLDRAMAVPPRFFARCAAGPSQGLEELRRGRTLAYYFPAGDRGYAAESTTPTDTTRRAG